VGGWMRGEREKRWKINKIVQKQRKKKAEKGR
jgi:hypothetical protein